MKDYSTPHNPATTYFEDRANPNTSTGMVIPGPDNLVRATSDPAEIVRIMGITEVTDGTTD